MVVGENSRSAAGRVHFTYKETPDLSSLCQGDLLAVTDELRDILREVHPYFLNEQYKYFMVLTQSCDLVRRDNSPCKTPYITLAAVKSFDYFFENWLLSSKLAEEINGFLIMNNKSKNRAYQLLERLYNNTEPDYFFLYKDAYIGLPESMIASLKVSIALKSKLHYDQCLAAKTVELSDEFKAKLGWLVGNIYSRVGTTDWESIMSAGKRKEMLDNELLSHCAFGSKEQINALKEEFTKNAEHFGSYESVNDFISNYHIDTQYEKAIKIIEEIIYTSSKEIPKEEKEKLLIAIKSRRALQALFSG